MNTYRIGIILWATVLSITNIFGCDVTDRCRVESFLKFIQTGTRQKVESADDIMFDTLSTEGQRNVHELYVHCAYNNQNVTGICDYAILDDTLRLQCKIHRVMDSSIMVTYSNKNGIIQMKKKYGANHMLHEIEYYFSYMLVYKDSVLPDNQTFRIYQKPFKKYKYSVGLLRKKLLCGYDVDLFDTYGISVKLINTLSDSVSMDMFNMQNDPIYGRMFNDTTRLYDDGSYYLFKGTYKDYLKILSSDRYKKYTTYKSKRQIERPDNRPLFAISVSNDALQYCYRMGNEIYFYIDAITLQTILITTFPSLARINGELFCW